MSATRFVVVGIGADGWDGLGDAAREALSGAAVIYGSPRQLALLDASVGAERIAWSSPMSEHLDAVAGGADLRPVVHILASGDPMFHGVGSSLVKRLGRDAVTVLPAPSSASLAAARLGWDLAATGVVSVVDGELTRVLAYLTDGADLLVMSRDGQTPRALAAILTEAGFGWSSMTVLSDLGGPDEAAAAGVARTWKVESVPALNIVAIHCVGPRRSAAPGLPDEQFDNDGQLTKQPIRALTISALAPAEGQLLWDVGAGSGSIGIEWLRFLRGGRVIAFESDPGRAARIGENAQRHGVSDRLTVAGAVPEALAHAPDPDTVFIGGGLTDEVLKTCWSVLPEGGRIVANAVTVESEQLLIAAHTEHGGELIRLGVERTGPLGGKTAWRPSLPVVQWTAVR